MRFFSNNNSDIKIDDRMDETRKIKKELSRANVYFHDLKIAEKFVEMEVKLLKDKKRQLESCRALFKLMLKKSRCNAKAQRESCRQ